MTAVRWLVALVLVATAGMPPTPAAVRPPGLHPGPRAALAPSVPRQAGARLLVRTGQRAPGGDTFTGFSDPSVNNHGVVVFGAVTTNPAAHEAVYLLEEERLTTLVVTGQPAPTGGLFSAFSDMVLNDRGSVIFLGRTTDRIARLGLYLARAGVLAIIVATGQAAPSGGVFTDFANPTINNQDVVAFVGRMTGRGGEGIFASSEGSTTALVVGGQVAPTGGAFQFFLDGTPAQNDRGQIAFVASTTARSTQGVYLLTGGRTIPVVTTENDAPVAGAFTEFGFVMLSDAGTIGFIGRTAHSAVHEALYVTGRAGLVPLARQGEVVEGHPLTTFTNAAMNTREEVVFEPGTPDPNPRAVYLATRSGVRPIAQAGDPAPGGGRFTAFSTPSLNALGQVAFVAETDDGHHGIYLVSTR